MVIFFLGRQPELSVAELQAVYQTKPNLVAPKIATLPIDKETALSQSNRLGSVTKIAELVADGFKMNVESIQLLATRLFDQITGKLTIGVSDYSPTASKKTAFYLGREIQAQLKSLGNSVRLVQSSGAVLPSATILHNHLATNNPKKVELNFIRDTSADSSVGNYLVAKTIYVQNITAYTFRDVRRPRLDARNGMLPPKLAQIIINLALGATRQVNDDNLLLDPFCGTGVVLQEAALMGLPVRGSDLNDKMIDNTNVNLQWLARAHHQAFDYQLTQADATSFDWQSWVQPLRVNTVATETYLGRPYAKAPGRDELNTNIANCNTVIGKFLANLAKQLPSGAGCCIGVPVWFVNNQTYHLPCLQNIERLNFVNKSAQDNLIYHRPNQIVGRELLVLQKR